MKHYAVIGRGGSNKRVILASLNDLPQDSHFHLLWTGEDPSPGQETIYDWLIDYEKTFTIYGTNVPKGLVRYAEEVSDAPMYTHLHKMGCDTALVLWEDGMDDIIITASPFFPRLLELTNGLTPIEVDDDEEGTTEEPQTVPVEPEQDESGELTRDELMSMPMAAVKRQAKERGIDFSGLSKAEIVDRIFAAPESVEEGVVLPPPAGVGDLEFIRGLVDEVRKIDKQWSECEEVIANLLSERRSLMQKISEALGLENGIL